MTSEECDLSPPEIECPADIKVDDDKCNSREPVYYPAPIVSDDSNVVRYQCTHESGSVFMVGETTVTCTATDGAGNEAMCSFKVKVLPCPIGPIVRPCRRYLIFPCSKTWMEAKSHCLNLQPEGYLAEIPDQATNNAIVSYIRNTGDRFTCKKYWFGAKYDGGQNEWRYLGVPNRSAKICYENWGNGEPERRNGCCGLIWSPRRWGTRNDDWTSAGCTEKNGFVCIC
ncbi:uncharacterized protein [Ptychodera flava]|uniref:uncharacterized protein n=1 Tax=Ptychodera flava TaxID=63121 RepID=UPI00396A9738